MARVRGRGRLTDGRAALLPGNKPLAGLVLSALREFASLLDKLALLVDSVAAPFRAMLQRVHNLAVAKGEERACAHAGRRADAPLGQRAGRDRADLWRRRPL